MSVLPTDPEVYPDESDLAERRCEGCGSTGYVPEHETGNSYAPSKCKVCTRGDFRRFLDRSEDTVIDRRDALRRLDSRQNLLPIPDPEKDGDLLTEVEVESVPGQGSVIEHMSHVTDRDCPECRHDRADRVRWSHWTAESGHYVICRVCDYLIEEESSL